MTDGKNPQLESLPFMQSFFNTTIILGSKCLNPPVGKREAPVTNFRNIFLSNLLS